MSMKSFKLDILGTKYNICLDDRGINPRFENKVGYCDMFNSEICVDTSINDSRNLDNTKNISEVNRKILRHELTHAFFYESGLEEYCRDEILVDFIAVQIKKLMNIIEIAEKKI